MSDNDDTNAIDKAEISRLFSLVELIPFYIIRRTIGLIYILIAATILMGQAISMILESILSPSIANPITLIIVSITLLLIFVLVSFPLQKAIRVQRYVFGTSSEKKDKSGKMWGFIWGIISVAIVILLFVSNYLQNDLLFYFGLQLLIGIGQMCNYLFSKRDKNYIGQIKNEYLYYSLFLIISSPIILIYSTFAAMFIEFTMLFCSYLFGLYILITSEKVFVEND